MIPAKERKAWFTDFGVLNTSAMSGSSKTILVPALYFLAYLPLTPLPKSQTVLIFLQVYRSDWFLYTFGLKVLSLPYPLQRAKGAPLLAPWEINALPLGEPQAHEAYPVGSVALR